MDVIVLAVTDDRKKVHVVENGEHTSTAHFPQGNALAWARSERKLLRYRVPRCRVHLSKPIK